MRLVRLTLYFFLGFVLGAWGVLGNAETKAALYGESFAAPATWSGYLSSALQSNNKATASAMCAGFNQTPTWTFSDTYHTCVSGTSITSVQVTITCPSGYSDVGNLSQTAGCRKVGYYCESGSNWTLSGSTCTRPDCDPATQTRDASGQCVALPCIGTGVAASGVFDVGTSPSSPPLSVCANGCTAIYSGGDTDKSAIVNGTRHYFASGSYTLVGGGASSQCTANGTNGMPPAAPTLPPDGCGPGAQKVTVGGRTKCVDPNTGQENLVDAPRDTVKKQDEQTANPDGTVRCARTYTFADGSKRTTYEDFPAGTVCAQVSAGTGTAGGEKVQGQPGSQADNASKAGAGSGGAGAEAPTDKDTGKPQGSMDDYCAKNPTASACQKVTSGDGAATDNLYTKDSKTFAGSLAAFKNAVQSAPFYTAATTFFQAGTFGGSCSGLSVTIPWWSGSYTVDPSPYMCGSTATTFYGYLGVALLLAAIGAAFWIALL
ncbi:MAG: hypothetical protein H6R10_605 [Rhodocyclaceae bacterium]|nr:hypothetical protein [Rhodocyclaceae bacterium]